MVGMTITSVDVIGEQYVDRLLAQESREPICGLGHRRPSESHLTRRVVEARRAEAAVGIPQLLHSGDPEQSRRILERISALGVRLAVDDFGTGYSSLAYLQQFPIAFLKIDGSFVQQMLVNEGASMVEAVTQLAHTLGLTPVAEGVESEAQLREVVRIGVDLAQGYHLSRPVSPDALFALLKSQRRSDALSSLTLLNPPTPLDSL